MAYASITKPSSHFSCTLHTGTGSTQQITTGLNMSANGGMVWNRLRDGTNNHVMWDTIRTATKTIYPDLNIGEATEATSLTAFTTTGWTGGGGGNTNGNGSTYASWNWLAGSSHSGTSNNDGTIATTVSVNTTAGFSIVKWTGTGSAGTIGHGLGAVPKTIWVKKTSQGDDWFIWHEALGAQGKINLNNSNAKQNDTGYWNNTLPTNQVFSVTSNGANNATGQVYIAYCFTNITGYSNFGTYIGNGSSSTAPFVGGTFVYTGFKPAFVMGKYIDGSGDWYLWDSKRLGYNRDNNKIKPNTNGAETTEDWIDLYANGFKFFNNSGDFNYAGYSFLYMAFAEEPLVANVGQSIPATAR